MFGTALLVAGLGVAGYGVYKATRPKRRMPEQLEVSSYDTEERIKQIMAATPLTPEQQIVTTVGDVLNTATTVATVGAVGAGALGAALPIVALVC